MTSNSHRCRALLVSAPASGQGKTTVTAALAQLARNQGLRVRVFKTGPDFLDPMILECASGQPVYQLDWWMGGETQCRQLLYEAAAQADLILIEGVMGLFDGEQSSADLAQQLGIPVLAVIDGSAMAQTFGALAFGLSCYREGLLFYGVMANRVGSARHAQMLAASMPASLYFLGALAKDAAFAIPERHLGLHQAIEITDLKVRINAAAAALEQLAWQTIPEVEFNQPSLNLPQLPRVLDGVHIAIARDAAFAFLYQANLDVLESLGAQLCFFSPLTDSELPSVDAVYLPGGYPELHAHALSVNTAMHAALRAHHAANKPILAECGGMMYLFEHLIDVQGERHTMAALLPGETRMHSRLQALALQSASLNVGALRGHSFHYSSMTTSLTPTAQCVSQHGTAAESVFREKNLTASYMHFYFPSNPLAVASLFKP